MLVSNCSKNLFKIHSSLEPAPFPSLLRSLLAKGLGSGCKTKTGLYGYAVRVFLCSLPACGTPSRKGSLAGVWAAGDEPPLPACIE